MWNNWIELPCKRKVTINLIHKFAKLLSINNISIINFILFEVH